MSEKEIIKENEEEVLELNEEELDHVAGGIGNVRTGGQRCM